MGIATPTYTAPRPAKQIWPSIYSPVPVIEPGSRGNHLPTGERPREALRPNIYPWATPQPGFAGRHPHRRRRLRHQVRQPSPTRPKQPPAQQPHRNTPSPANLPPPPRPYPTPPTPSPADTPAPLDPSSYPTSLAPSPAKLLTPPDTATAPPPLSEPTPSVSRQHNAAPPDPPPTEPATQRHNHPPPAPFPRQQNNQPSLGPPPRRQIHPAPRHAIGRTTPAAPPLHPLDPFDPIHSSGER